MTDKLKATFSWMENTLFCPPIYSPERMKIAFEGFEISKFSGLEKGDQWPLVDTVGYSIQTCRLLQFILKPQLNSKWAKKECIFHLETMHKLKLYFKMLLQVYSQFSLELSQLDAKAKFLKCYVDSAHIFLNFNIIWWQRIRIRHLQYPELIWRLRRKPLHLN